MPGEKFLTLRQTGGQRPEYELSVMDAPAPVTANPEVFDRIAGFYETRSEHLDSDLAESVRDGIDIAEKLGIKPGDKAFVLSPSLYLWAECAMCARGARVTVMDGSSDRIDDKRFYFTEMLDGMDVEGIQELRQAMDENCEFIHANFLYVTPKRDSMDVLCMSGVLDSGIDDADEILLKGLEALKEGGRLAIGFYTPEGYNTEKVKEVATRNGYVLEEIPCDAIYGDENENGAIFLVKQKPKSD